MRVVGVDVGVAPAMALLDMKSGKIAESLVIPLRADGHMDEEAVCENLRRMAANLVVTEKLQAFPKQGASSGFNFGFAWGVVVGCARALGAEVYCVRPVEWKKLLGEAGYSLGPDRPERGTKLNLAARKQLDLDRKAAQKAAAIAFVQARYPEVNLVHGRRRTPDNNLADAVCLADYGATFYELDHGS